jgi:hypothetical protein
MLRSVSCYSAVARLHAAQCELLQRYSALWSSMLRPFHILLLLAALGHSSFGCFVSKNSFAFFFWLLWSCVATQLHEESNSNCIADFIFSLLLLMV